MAIFISYRREDSAGWAGRLFDGLAAAFGAEAVFLDVTDIGAGTDFARQLEASLEQSALLLAVIGPNWLTVSHSAGGRRLDDERDFIRLELATALRRGIPLIPVLVGGARMPAPDELPPALQELARRQAVELRHERWTSDLALLTEAIRQTLSQATSPDTRRALRSRRALLLALGLTVAIGGMAWFGWFRPGSKPDREVMATNAPPAGVLATEALLVAENVPEVVTFGTVTVGRSSQERRIRIVNRGAETAAVHRAGVVGEHASDFVLVSQCNGLALASGEACEVSVRFRPTTVGPRQASIAIDYLSRNNPLLLRLFGQGR
jgi:hypothetical protein